jgi:2-succinyl-5-enolpyruvyl-6-hydroxy-3-cyclohexene-1-carboxylate synthase
MPAENAGRAFGLVLVDELAAHGVTDVVISPGSRSTPLALAFIEHPDIETHVRIDERSAAFLALGIAKESGEVVPVLCTSGTAAAHFHAAVMEADLARVALLVLTADRPAELHGIGANQTVEQQGIYGGAVRWAPRIAAPEAHAGAVEEWRGLVAEAWEWCQGRRGGPPGPVHLNLPLREPLVPVDDGIGFPYELGLGSPRGVPLPGLRHEPPPELATRVGRARTGVIVVGSVGASPIPPHYRGPSNAVGCSTGALDLAAAAGWPVIAEPQSNARRGRQALRSTDALLRDGGFAGTHRPELALVVGRVGLSRTLLSWLESTPHVVVSPDGGNWDVTRTAELVVHCPASALERIPVEPAAPSWLEDWLVASDTVSTRLDELIDEGERLTEPRTARDVAALLPDGSALVVASSMPIRDLDLVMRPREHLDIYANRGVSGIDGFVSTAMGVALSRRMLRGRTPDRPTVALCGDLSVLHDVNGLMPGPDPRPDVTFVVINNNGGGIFSVLPQSRSVEPAVAERLWGTPHNMSLERLAAAYQVDHCRVETADQLERALSAYGGVRMIEVRTDRAENAVLHERLRAVSLAGG